MPTMTINEEIITYEYEFDGYCRVHIPIGSNTVKSIMIKGELTEERLHDIIDVYRTGYYHGYNSGKVKAQDDIKNAIGIR